MITVHDDPEPAFLPRERGWLAAGAICLAAFLLFLGAIANLDVIGFPREPSAAVAAEALGASAGLHWFAILVIWLGLATAEGRGQRRMLHTMMGVAPEQAARALLAAGADAIGGNCGNGPDELLPVIERMHAVAPDAVLTVRTYATTQQATRST